MTISRNSAILDFDLFYFGHESSSWVELRLHTENQLTRCPGYGLILVRVSYYLLVICYGGKVKSTNLSWVRVGLGWVGLKFDNITPISLHTKLFLLHPSQAKSNPDEFSELNVKLHLLSSEGNLSTPTLPPPP